VGVQGGLITFGGVSRILLGHFHVNVFLDS